jgi:fucokinase
MNESGFVGEFLHKQSVETLTEKGAVNENGMVDIDTGAIVFSARVLNSLFELIGENGRTDSEKLDTYVNERARLSLYGDFLYPLAANATEEQYMKEPRRAKCATSFFPAARSSGKSFTATA